VKSWKTIGCKLRREKVKKFNIRLKIEEDESLIGFLYRMTIANYHSSTKMVCDDLGMKWWEMPLNAFNKDACETLSQLCGISGGELYLHSYHSITNKLGEKEKINWFHHSKVMYCPECLKERRIHKYLWGFKHVNLCMEHVVLLIHTCQKCEKQITIGSLIKGECKHCDFDLSMAKADRAKKEGLIFRSQGKIQHSLVGGKNHVYKNLDRLQLIALIAALKNLFKGFEGFEEFTNMAEEMPVQFNDESNKAKSLAIVYWILFENFPHNFHYALQMFNDSNSLRKKYRKRVFSNFLSNHEEYSLFKIELDNFKELQVVQGKVPRNIKTFDEVSFSKLRNLYYSKRDIHKQFDITRSEIEKLCENKILKPKVVHRENHTNYYFLRTETELVLKTFIQEKKGCMTKKEVAKILGVSLEALRHLLEKRLVVEKESSICKQFTAIDRSSVEVLVSQITEKIIVIGENEAEFLLDYKKGIHKFVTSGLQIGLLFQWILKGEIECYSTSKEYFVENFYFKEAELIERLHQNKIETNGYCLGDVSRVLGFTERTIHKMIKAKLIIPCKIYEGTLGKEMYFFDKDIIDEFRWRFISPQDAALKYGVNQSTLYNFIHRKILRNYAEGVCRKALFDREKLEVELIKRSFIK
jgi:hypothetical protein